MLDVRKPIGWLFLIIGALLSIYAVVDPQVTTLTLVSENPTDLILNLNLPCGISMFVFACVMLGLSFADDKRKAAITAPEHSSTGDKDSDAKAQKLVRVSK